MWKKDLNVICGLIFVFLLMSLIKSANSADEQVKSVYQIPIFELAEIRAKKEKARILECAKYVQSS
jgi:hypothetical protein